jgi:hypothetical protein
MNRKLYTFHRRSLTLALKDQYQGGCNWENYGWSILTRLSGYRWLPSMLFVSNGFTLVVFLSVLIVWLAAHLVAQWRERSSLLFKKCGIQNVMWITGFFFVVGWFGGEASICVSEDVWWVAEMFSKLYSPKRYPLIFHSQSYLLVY